jgi:hypothetical protein
MVQKGESHRTENGEDFLLRYGTDGWVKIFMTDTKTGSRESWAATKAQIIQKTGQSKIKPPKRVQP